MLDRNTHLRRAKDLGILSEDLSLISNSYKEGDRDGMKAHQSCLPLEIIKSNLIREILARGDSGCLRRGNATNKNGKLIELMARAYYDAFNAEIIERGILSSEYFPLE